MNYKPHTESLSCWDIFIDQKAPIAEYRYIEGVTEDRSGPARNHMIAASDLPNKDPPFTHLISAV